MSRWNRRITALLAVLLICTLSACGQSQIPLDYGDETAFEADLNAGKNAPLSAAPSGNAGRYSEQAGHISPDGKALFFARICAAPSCGQARHSPLFRLFSALRQTLSDRLSILRD